MCKRDVVYYTEFQVQTTLSAYSKLVTKTKHYQTE